MAAISAARQRLEQRQQEAGRQRGREPDDPPRGGRYKRAFGVPEDKAQDNFTNCASDAGELPPMLQAVRENLGRLPARVLADTGYKSEAVFEALAGNGCELIVALGREGKHPLRFDPTLTCAVERRDLPAGDRPARRLSFPPVAIGAAVEVTRRLEPLV